MANFCSGDFSSFSDSINSSSSFRKGRGRQRYSSSPAAGRKQATTSSRGHGNNRAAPLGVSQWGRQQLSYPGPAGSHTHDSFTAVQPGKKHQGRGGGRVGGWGGGGGGGGWGGEQADISQPVRMTIQDLSPHMANSSIVGVVMMKHGIRSFPDKRNPGAERFRFMFTLRDTPVDYINVTCWASDFNYINSLHSSFKINDVVEVVNGQVSSKPIGEGDEKWSPWTPSSYQINLSETHSTLALYAAGKDDHAELASLTHAPLRPARDCHALSTIVAGGQSMDGMHVSIIAAIRHIGAPKEMTSKSGRKLKKCEVKLMDKDCSSFNLLIWNEEIIELAQTWSPKENIIFAVDVKAYFDSYRNCMSAVCDQKTLIVTNPDCTEAYQLYQFSQSVELGPEQNDFSLEVDTSFQDNIQSITEVFSIETLKERQGQGKVMVSGGGGAAASSSWGSNTSSSSALQSFTGILYAYLVRLNITGDPSSFICYRCDMCNFRVAGQTGSMTCSNKSCPSHTSAPPPVGGATSLTASDYADWGGLEEGRALAVSPHFNLWISLADCTGEIEGVWLGGKVASELLGYTPTEFLNLSEDKKIAVKNTLLLEKFKVYFKSCNYQGDQKRPQVKILSMAPANPSEVVAHLPM